ncbi:hypothetical protein WH96_20185 [Kiloniella spongiae]|uniref:Class I SAM-dependent methyltransferase n=1 Tax=Kiloniella spongiae TaxID=1489064 RepID=A0A0H2MQL4_9PROT|nr:hypothetical protein WH96_20185 [Kiloniella spongiae]
MGLKPFSAIDTLGDAPLCDGPRTNYAGYMTLFESTRNKSFPIIDSFENRMGAAISTKWIETLALHTQIVVKKSELNYQHGRIVYTALRHRCERLLSNYGALTVFETGTARGFSALCMAKALHDAEQAGQIITVDILPHDQAMYWNCIDDIDGKKSRRELLSPWDDLLNSIVFNQSETKTALVRLGLNRIHFAFLDASHTFEDVINEFNFVSSRQKLDDIIVFDDVTPQTFPGVVEAIECIRNTHPYDVEYLKADEARCYAIATRQR